MKKKAVRYLKVDDKLNLIEGSFDPNGDDSIGDVMFGDGRLAEVISIRYEPLFDALRENKLSKSFVALVDEEGLMRQLPLNFFASFVCGKMILGDVCIIKMGRINFVDMSDAEYDFMKRYLSYVISVMLEEIARNMEDV